MKAKHCPAAFALLALVACSIPVASRAADEHILSFHSDIEVHADASMTVTETIAVRSAGKEIKRGIYRDFPTRYKDRIGHRYLVGFQVLEVLRDGKPEGYHIEHQSNGRRVYIGKRDVFLDPGEYTYTLKYETARQIGMFDDHDELYWNVTGLGWAFPILRASATVRLPENASWQILEVDAFTGPRRARRKNFKTSRDADQNVTFTTTQKLYAHEGLTIVVTWPKGFVKELTPGEKAELFLKDNVGVLVGWIGFAAVLLFYIIAWGLVGKDPPPGTIIPLYHPPRNISPAAARYIREMGYDHKTLAAALIHMAVQGYLKITESGGVYEVKKTGSDDSVLAREEKKIAAELFAISRSMKFKQSNHLSISSAIEEFKKSLKRRFETVYFVTNRRYFFTGLLLSFIAIVLMFVFTPKKEGGAVFLSIWLAGWTVGTVALVGGVIATWRAVFTASGARGTAVGAAVFMTIFATPFVVFECFGAFMVFRATSVSFVGLLLVIASLNALFYHLLKAPTLEGRRMLDKIDGFRMFLSVAEKDRLEFAHPAEKTPELFEAYLPYALALDVENEWAEQFADVLVPPGETEPAYSPGWYSGSSWSRLGASSFAGSLGSSVAGAISSSSTAPGSSSGGGGGGSSGGGGGGGGGGGW